MNTILNKLKDFVGLNESEEYYDYEEEETTGTQNRYQEEVSQPEPEERLNRRQTREPLNFPAKSAVMETTTTRSNVIGMPGIANGMPEVVVIEPHSFEEMPQVIQTLRERKSVVLNLNVMDPEEAQRAVDFVAGGTYAIDGHQERIGESVFLFTPSCVKVSTLSGTVHEVPDVPPASVRPAAPMPAWSAESSRIAQ